MHKRVMSILLAAAACSVAMTHGLHGPAAAAPGQAKTFITAPGEVVAGVITPQGLVKTASAQMDGPIPVIIQLRDEPLLSLKRTLAAKGLPERSVRLQQHQERLKVAQAEVMAWLQSMEPGKRAGDVRQYHFVFNGLATTVSPGTLKQLEQHPRVARVFRDGVAKANLADSVPLIGAPQMWTSYGADGQGVRVAVIDTGIDYTHPDLGGGFGPGFKVIGGYDFVHGDSDPMDDQGHGTHVAGIIAASGAVKGVAPGVKLLAYKVLDELGSGQYSTIIAGIDRAVDPDQNPLTNDGAQVINLSLGGPGDPDDAISQAVDTAVAAGVVCVVAAGNNGGNGNSTIGSPGCARTALTVGASDKMDVMAYFSSRGPSQPDLAIKPDLTAPGVAIRSTIPGGGYAVKDGTSMATPHVAGAVALLLQLHPAWTPEVVKGVLAERAKDLGQDAFSQGGGRIQVVASHLAKAVALPSNLNFGVVDVSLGVWSKTLQVRLQNLEATSRTYALSMQGVLPGVTWTLNPASVQLDAGQTQVVSLTLTVDNSTLPYGPPPTLAYGAKLVATAADDTLSLPVVFYKASVLTMTFSKYPFYVALFDQNNDPNDGFSYKFYYPRSGALTALLPPRAYDIICFFLEGPQSTSGLSYVLREGLNVTGNVPISIDLDHELMYRTQYKPIKVSGNAFPINSANSPSTEYYLQNSNGANVFGSTGQGVSDVYFSAMSSSYVFNLIQSGWIREGTVSQYHEYKYDLRNGVTQPLVVPHSPIKVLKVSYNLDPSIGSVWVDFFRYINTPGIAIGLSSASFNPQSAQALSPPFEMEAHLSILPATDFGFNQTSPWVTRLTNTYGSDPLLEGGLIGVPDAGTAQFHFLCQPATPYHSTHADRVTLGESPHVSTGRLLFPSQGRAVLQSGNGFAIPIYLGPMADAATVSLPLQLFQGASLVQSGIIPRENGLVPTQATLDFTPGAYTLRLPFDAYFVNGQRGQALASMSFDSTKADPAPPYLKRLKVLRDGEAASITFAGSLNQLSLRVEDDVALTQLQAFYQVGGSAGAWVPLPLPSPAGQVADCLVDLPAGLPPGPVNLRLLATDPSGNAFEQELTPAFYHVQPVLPTIDAQPQGITALEGQTATFTVAASGTGPLEYQWRKNGTAIIGARASTYTTPFVTLGDQNAAFSVMVTNPLGSVTSGDATLTVATLPAVSAQPQDATVVLGKTATFSVTATGTGPLSYQWLKNRVAIAGATSSTCVTPPTSVGDQNAVYTVVVTSPFGSVMSRDAALAVLVPMVEIQPGSVSCFPGEMTQFSGKVTLAADPRVTWSASGGRMDPSGLFTAPATAGSLWVKATGVEDPSRQATVWVTVRGTNFDGNTATNPKLLGLANAMGSTNPDDLAAYDFNGDGRIDESDLAKLFLNMGW